MMARPGSPFHAGEIAAQHRAGIGQQAAEAGHFIRPAMPEQHQAFFAALPFVVVAGGDATGTPWVTMLEGDPHPLARDDATHLRLTTRPADGDPLAAAFVEGAPIGILGIELASRRRNRVNGVLRAGAGALTLEVAQSFGNCPQHIHPRPVTRSAQGAQPPGPVRISNQLDTSQRRWIETADTFFIGTGFRSGDGAAEGYDASHRGGAPGFVRIGPDGRLHIPDYAGNNYFNTIGNLLRDPRVALLFVDFQGGGLLHLSGTAEIDWEARASHDPQAQREVIVTLHRVIERPAALTLRWRPEDRAPLGLQVLRKVVESPEITSFYLAAQDGSALPPFRAGQHLPLALDIPGHSGPVQRSYSLSGPQGMPFYRISVKREAEGLASRHLHDRIGAGDLIKAAPPSGDFALPTGDGPLVLVSAGVGVTPMMAMLYTAARAGRQVWFVHGTRNGAARAFGAEVAAIMEGAESIRQRIYHSQPTAADGPQSMTQRHGRIDPGELIPLSSDPRTDYMICGSETFVATIVAGLEKAGIPASRLHFESFGGPG